MAESGSLLLNAKRLTAKARVKRDNAAGVQADGQLATALNKLTAQFSELETQLNHYIQLRKAGIPVSPVPDLTRAAEKLKTQIAVGRPTPQFLNSRSADIAGTTKALRTLCDDAWQNWAAERRASLVVERELIHGLRGQQVTDKLDQITKESVKPFQQANISLFKLWVDQAADLIAQLESPTTPENVISRIQAQRGSLTLADLTVEELEALRQSPEHSRRVRLNVP